MAKSTTHESLRPKIPACRCDFGFWVKRYGCQRFQYFHSLFACLFSSRGSSLDGCWLSVHLLMDMAFTHPRHPCHMPQTSIHTPPSLSLSAHRVDPFPFPAAILHILLRLSCHVPPARWMHLIWYFLSSVRRLLLFILGFHCSVVLRIISLFRSRCFSVSLHLFVTFASRFSWFSFLGHFYSGVFCSIRFVLLLPIYFYVRAQQIK